MNYKSLQQYQKKVASACMNELDTTWSTRIDIGSAESNDYTNHLHCNNILNSIQNNNTPLPADPPLPPPVVARQGACHPPAASGTAGMPTFPHSQRTATKNDIISI
jgi:hypothetical protein